MTLHSFSPLSLSLSSSSSSFPSRTRPVSISAQPFIPIHKTFSLPTVIISITRRMSRCLGRTQRGNAEIKRCVSRHGEETQNPDTKSKANCKGAELYKYLHCTFASLCQTSSCSTTNKPRIPARALLLRSVFPSPSPPETQFKIDSVHLLTIVEGYRLVRYQPSYPVSQDLQDPTPSSSSLSNTSLPPLMPQSPCSSTVHTAQMTHLSHRPQTASFLLPYKFERVR